MDQSAVLVSLLQHVEDAVLKLCRSSQLTGVWSYAAQRRDRTNQAQTLGLPPTLGKSASNELGPRHFFNMAHPFQSPKS